MAQSILMAIAFAAAAVLGVSSRAVAQSGVVSWGGVGSPPPLPPGLTYTEISAGCFHNVARRSDGSIVAWGSNAAGQCNVPALPANLTYVAISAGHSFTLALRSDGSVVAFGANQFGQCDVLPLPPGLTYVEIAAGLVHSVARRSDGSVVAWGDNQFGQCTVPPLPSGTSVLKLDAGGHKFGFYGYSMALLSDGSVLGWGYPDFTTPPPLGGVYVDIAAGEGHAMYLRDDGFLWSTGDCFAPGVCYSGFAPPGTQYIQIDAGWAHNVVLRSDGVVEVFGFPPDSPLPVPPLAPGLRYVEVSSGNYHGLARFEGCPTCEPPFCVADGGDPSVPCPCGNQGALGRGCDNSAGTGGAGLTAQGSVEPDRIALSATGMLPSSLCIFFQGKSALGVPVAFGDGVRCIGGRLKRLGVRTAVGGASSFPTPGDASISARSAAVGDLIRPGTFRYYQVWYRDMEPGFCLPAPATFNASNAVMVRW
jgi:hypothetical protein